MAIEEHLVRLNLGAANWNSWKDTLPPGWIDLSKADLSESDLSDFDLSGVNLRKASFSMAILNNVDLSRSDLTEANFFRVDLKDADLSHAKLTKADFTEANCTRANFTMAVLSQSRMDAAILAEAILHSAIIDFASLILTDFTSADLSEVDLSNANLRQANFSHAYLNRANLSNTYFFRANLSEADFSEANLNKANLSEVSSIEAVFSESELVEAYLHKADFSRTDFSGSDLSRVQALETNFHSAIFTGVCLEDWNINNLTNLDGVICEYVYLSFDRKRRCPASGSFKEGEFSKLFEKILDTVDLIFRDGIDWKAFLFSFQELQVQYGEKNLSIQAIEQKTNGAFVIRLNILSDINKIEAEQRIKELYEAKISFLDAKYHTELSARDEQIIIYRQHNASLEKIIYALANQPIQNIIDVTAKSEGKFMSETYKSKYDQSHAQIGGIVDTAQANSHQEFSQHNYASEQKQTLVEAAAEIQELLKQLEKTNPTATETDQIAYVNDETTPSFKRRVVGALQSSGETAIDEFILENKYLKVVKAAVKGWLQPDG